MNGHRYQVRAYYADTDAGGIVYHAAYLAMAERARTEALRDAGVPHGAMLAEHGRMFMVRRVNLEYLRPARLDDMLTITTETLAETGATLSLRQAFAHQDGSAAATLLVELVCVSSVTFKPARIPPRWRHIVQPIAQ